MPKMTDWGDQITVDESRSLILGQMRAPKFSCFLMSDKLLERYSLACHVASRIIALALPTGA
ncbi:MAG: hypothetical protein ABIU05_28040, partial [Nitrospirales bacterium]